MKKTRKNGSQCFPLQFNFEIVIIHFYSPGDQFQTLLIKIISTVFQLSRLSAVVLNKAPKKAIVSFLPFLCSALVMPLCLWTHPAYEHSQQSCCSRLLHVIPVMLIPLGLSSLFSGVFVWVCFETICCLVPSSSTPALEEQSNFWAYSTALVFQAVMWTLVLKALHGLVCSQQRGQLSWGAPAEGMEAGLAGGCVLGNKPCSLAALFVSSQSCSWLWSWGCLTDIQYAAQTHF